ncbi:hypothetical protein Tco_0148502, partial [Tanacetum coccineum]
PPYNNGQVLPVHAVNYDFQELEGRVKRSTQGSKACQIIKVPALGSVYTCTHKPTDNTNTLAKTHVIRVISSRRGWVAAAKESSRGEILKEAFE